jgi:transcriptional regulator with XRE-family HTH domain
MRNTHIPAYRAFLKRLIDARKAAGFTQVEVAKALKLPQSAVSRMESGERRIDIIEAAEFAKLYKCSIADLVP